eukprot:567390-Rhodomonas_salina.1
MIPFYVLSASTCIRQSRYCHQFQPQHAPIAVTRPSITGRHEQQNFHRCTHRWKTNKCPMEAALSFFLCVGRRQG